MMSECVRAVALFAVFGMFVGFMVGVLPLIMDWAERVARAQEWGRMTEEQRDEVRKMMRKRR
jgi:hypothetical protein